MIIEIDINKLKADIEESFKDWGHMRNRCEKDIITKIDNMVEEFNETQRPTPEDL